MTAPEKTAGQAAKYARMAALANGGTYDPVALRVYWQAMTDAERDAEEIGAQAAIDWWFAERDLEPPQEITAKPQPAPDLGAAYADLQSEIRNAVSLHCSGPGVPCELCLRETDRAMKAIDVYARDVAQHERTREQPAPELAAAMANAEVAYEQWIGQRNPADVGSMAGFTAGWQLAVTAASGWPTCPNGCGCRLGTEDADQRDCACDGLCCYDEIEVSELFAERDKLRRQFTTLAASLDADALATQPSKKSQIQADAARRIREALA